MAAKDNGIVPTGLFIQSLNELIDDQEKRLTALRNRVPNVVLLALYGVAAVAGAFSGYAGELGKRSSRLPMYVMIFLIAAVILLIQDLDRPSTGFITTSQQPMIDTAAAIAKILSGSVFMIATSTVVIYTGVAPRWLPWRGHYRKSLSQLELPLCSSYGCF